MDVYSNFLVKLDESDLRRGLYRPCNVLQSIQALLLGIESEPSDESALAWLAGTDFLESLSKLLLESDCQNYSYSGTAVPTSNADDVQSILCQAACAFAAGCHLQKRPEVDASHPELGGDQWSSQFAQLEPKFGGLHPEDELATVNMASG